MRLGLRTSCRHSYFLPAVAPLQPTADSDGAVLAGGVSAADSGLRPAYRGVAFDEAMVHPAQLPTACRASRGGWDGLWAGAGMGICLEASHENWGLGGRKGRPGRNGDGGRRELLTGDLSVRSK